MTEDLIAWLRAQIDDDERVIAAACLHIDDCGDSGFASRFDDDRMLADIAAKRLILDEHEPLANGACDTCSNGMWSGEHQIWPCRTVRLLAQPYADRPGFREEWRA